MGDARLGACPCFSSPPFSLPWRPAIAVASGKMKSSLKFKIRRLRCSPAHRPPPPRGHPRTARLMRNSLESSTRLTAFTPPTPPSGQRHFSPPPQGHRSPMKSGKLDLLHDLPLTKSSAALQLIHPPTLPLHRPCIQPASSAAILRRARRTEVISAPRRSPSSRPRPIQARRGHTSVLCSPPPPRL